MTIASLLSMVEVALGVGIGAGIAMAVLNAIERLIRRSWPEPPATPPRSYVIQLTDEDGWPFRTYRLNAKEVGRLVGDLDREHPK